MIYSVLGSVYSGATVVLMPRWDRELAGRLISRHRITHWVCIPTMVIDLFGSPNYKSFDLSSLRSMSGGGAAMPHAVAQRLLDEFGVSFAEGYGLTETAAPSHANPPERAKLQCLGIPIFSVDSRHRRSAEPEELPVGEVGEIITRGPMVFKGYWKHPEATADAFVEFRRALVLPHRRPRQDGRGRLLLHDRPAEADDQRQRLQGLAGRGGDAALQAPGGAGGLHHRRQGRLPRRDGQGVVVLRADGQGHHAEDIVAWAKEHMAAYKVPKIVQFVDALPKSGSGKVMWRLLQDQEASARASLAGVETGGEAGSGARPGATSAVRLAARA
jgi:fatty-acyl-CoA synthase